MTSKKLAPAAHEDQQDPLLEHYRGSFINVAGRVRALREQNAALLSIDLQYLDAAPGHGVFAERTKSGVSPEAQAYYFSQLSEKVLPNVQRLQRCFRDCALEVIHTRICSLTQDGRDRGAGHKRLGLHAAPNSKEADFLPEVAPDGDEIIINKTASGVFACTNLAYVLHNLEIKSLFVVGVYTNECVSTTVRDACDLGFYVTVVEDACTTVTQELHDATITILRDRYARIMTTEQAIEHVKRTTKATHE